MNTTNEDFGNDRRPKDSPVFVRLRLGALVSAKGRAGTGSPRRVRCGRLRAFACFLIVVSFGSKVVCGEISIDELDPTSLLATDFAQSDARGEHSRAEEPGLPDIQIPPQPDFDTTQPTANFTTKFVAAVKDEISQTSPPPADTPARQLELQLWKSRARPLDQRRDNDKADDLRQVIEQIRSVVFEPQQPTNNAPAISPEANTAPTAESATQLVPASTQPEAPAKSMSDQTLRTVQHLLKDPNHIPNALELAEILYRSGESGPAGLCYKKALNSIATDDPNRAGERAWILFQIGNCLKDDDPNTARESYAELIRTHPNSPWAEIAKSEHGLIDWYQQDQPRKLIQELNR